MFGDLYSSERLRRSVPDSLEGDSRSLYFTTLLSLCSSFLSSCLSPFFSFLSIDFFLSFDSSLSSFLSLLLFERCFECFFLPLESFLFDSFSFPFLAFLSFESREEDEAVDRLFDLFARDR